VSVRVVIADDQGMVRAGFRSLLDDEPGIEVVGEASDGQQAVASIERYRPDVALMDVRMPVMDGIEATRRITAAGSRTRVLLLTTFDLDEYVFEGLRAGASGFLLKDASPEQLIAAIHLLADGEAVLAPAVTRRVLETFARLPAPRTELTELAESLTPRERDALVLLARGCSNGEIARTLFVSETTAKTHVRNVLAKLRVRDRVHAAIFAYESGLVRPGDDAG
jgi:DNA-binding NarL/FixJ family response regulator